MSLELVGLQIQNTTQEVVFPSTKFSRASANLKILVVNHCARIYQNMLIAEYFAIGIETN